MEIALQLLIWLGSGFAFAIGVTLGVFLTVQVTKRGDKGHEQAERANEYLRQRNEIGQQQVEAMLRIACAIENHE